MKFTNTKVMNIDNAIRGARNPKNSWNLSDSDHGYIEEEIYNDKESDFYKEFHDSVILSKDERTGIIEYQKIGPKDMKLLTTLTKAGPAHRKFLRQIFITVDITAPLYWWKEYDTYKVGTVANSTSSMHTLTNFPITKDNFEIFDLDENNEFYKEYWDRFITYYENLRKRYIETKDKKIWKAMIQIMPNAWLQTRTCTLNYEILLNMCRKDCRRNHVLNEWSGIDDKTRTNFIAWVRSLPYAQEFIFYDENN